MGDLKHTSTKRDDFHAGVTAARKALRQMERAIQSADTTGPAVQMPAAEALTSAAGRLGEFERGFVTVLAELAFQDILYGGVEPREWKPYCACGRREIEAEARRYAVAAMEDAERGVFLEAKRRQIEAGKVVDLAQVLAQRER